MKKNIIISACLGLITSLAVILLFNIPILGTINAKCIDIMFKLRGDIDIYRDIVLLEIDDKTIDAYGSCPLKKDIYARIVEVLSKARVKAIGFDMSFSDVDGKNDSYFASA